MKKIFLITCFVVLGFYAAWPAYSLYEIATAIKAKEEAVIARKVAWEPLRNSLRVPVTLRVNKEIANQSKGYGLQGALAGQLASEMTPKMVEKILDAYVTPKGVITLANQGGKINAGNLGIGNVVNNLLANNKEADGTGGSALGNFLNKAKDIVNSIPGGKELLATQLSKFSKNLTKDIASNADKKSSTGAKTNYGLQNIKHFKFINPWSFEIGLSKSPTAKSPDVIAGMSFIDRDWKLSKLVPTL